MVNVINLVTIITFTSNYEQLPVVMFHNYRFKWLLWQYASTVCQFYIITGYYSELSIIKYYRNVIYREIICVLSQSTVFPRAHCISCRVSWSITFGHSESVATSYSELHVSTSQETLTVFPTGSDTLLIFLNSSGSRIIFVLWISEAFQVISSLNSFPCVDWFHYVIKYPKKKSQGVKQGERGGHRSRLRALLPSIRF
jgi:hypothetical protein